MEARKKFYDWLADTIKINGIIEVNRDTEFDDETYYRSGGIRLYYQTFTEAREGIKEGILLEAGIDKVTPNNTKTISSWAYDKAVKQGVAVIDNRAIDIACYHPGYTFVEKLQTVATKFRQEQDTKVERQNLMRQYYDIYSLLGNDEVKKFIGTKEYSEHKIERFPKVDFDIPITENEAFLLLDVVLRSRFIQRYKATATLHYNGQADFEEMLTEISKWVEKL